ncbi:MAG: hypothetical protein KUG76_05280 [Gammaproteobacteria bacterium]|nr:hypothetical protein [Gammaproteobacteria bacterium]
MSILIRIGTSQKMIADLVGVSHSSIN